MWINKMTTAALVLGLATGGAFGSGSDTTVTDTFDCSTLPTDLLERSLTAGEDLFKPSVAEQFGWRPWDEEFQDATGLRKSEFFAKPESKTMTYEGVIYQRLDLDKDGKDEIFVFSQYMQGIANFRIEYELQLFCDSVNWRNETCDGSSAGARANLYFGYRFRMIDGHRESLGKYSVTDLPNINAETERAMGVTKYDHGAALISILGKTYIAITELFYADASEEVTAYGSTLWPLTADSLGKPLFCTWRK
jgi:hypothetical protein